jgi:hypothetical protein
MIKTITSDDVVRYLYAETNREESAFIEQQIAEDAELRQYCKQFNCFKISIDTLHYEPSQKSVDAILEYSKNL